MEELLNNKNDKEFLEWCKFFDVINKKIEYPDIYNTTFDDYVFRRYTLIKRDQKINQILNENID